MSGRLVASRMGLLAGRVWAPEHEAGRSGRAGIRSMCGEATQAAEEAAPESATGLGKDSGLFDPEKQRYRGNNLFDILRQLNYHGSPPPCCPVLGGPPTSIALSVLTV